MASVTDSASGITSRYYYDFSGRSMGYREDGTGFSHSVGYEFDNINNLTSYVETINGQKRTSSYIYDDDNRITSATVNGITISYVYDAFGRLTQKTTKNGDTVVLTEYYTFKETQDFTSGQVWKYRTKSASVDITYEYTYDDNGNILTVSDGTRTTSYSYDSANQLIREDNPYRGLTYTWNYDNAGNIEAFNSYLINPTQTDETKLTSVDSVEYAYADDDWGDLLTGVDGTTITHDAIGNPLTYGTTEYTWEHGRQLKSMKKNDVTWTYNYNNAGLRTARTNGTTTYKYVYDGSMLKQMTIATSSEAKVVDFTYDAVGSPLTMTYDGETYYYITNLQGDVVGLLDDTGAKVITYQYTAYGEGYFIDDESTMTSTMAMINPLGYRGYVMDIGTNTYYCQSRYYDPTIGRWINGDALTTTGQGFVGNNMFAYCLNNPVIYGDYEGYDAVLLFNKERYGHIGALVQDADGNWWHFYWGRATGTLGAQVGLGSEVPVNKQLCEVETEYDYCITMRDVENAHVFNGHYDRSIYLTGDFSACIEKMKTYSSMYDVYNKNCTQVTFSLLAHADTEYSDKLRCVAENYITPSKAYSFFHQLYLGKSSINEAKKESSWGAACDYLLNRFFA